ncbi:DUF4244 domain-containing protein [Spirillospora sp. NPDC050679]
MPKPDAPGAERFTSCAGRKSHCPSHGEHKPPGERAGQSKAVRANASGCASPQPEAHQAPGKDEEHEMKQAKKFKRSLSRRWRTVRDAGMSTVEYAVGTVAAAAFAGLLFKIASSPEVRTMLLGIIKKALALGG